MKKLLPLLLLASCVFTQRAVRADDAASVKDILIGKYIGVRQAFEKNRPGDLVEMETSNFTYVTIEGEVISKAKSNANQRTGMSMMTKVHSVKVTINRMNLLPASAVPVKAAGGKTRMLVIPARVVIVNTIELDFDSQQPGAKEANHYHVTTSNLDTWIQDNGDWKIMRSEGLRSRITENGKVLYSAARKN